MIQIIKKIFAKLTSSNRARSCLGFSTQHSSPDCSVCLLINVSNILSSLTEGPRRTLSQGIHNSSVSKIFEICSPTFGWCEWWTKSWLSFPKRTDIVITKIKTPATTTAVKPYKYFRRRAHSSCRYWHSCWVCEYFSIALADRPFEKLFGFFPPFSNCSSEGLSTFSGPNISAKFACNSYSTNYKIINIYIMIFSLKYNKVYL